LSRCRLGSTLRASAASAWSGAPGSRPGTCAPWPPVVVPRNRWTPGRAWPEARLITGNSMEVIQPVMSWTYASGQRKRRLDSHPVNSYCRKLPRGADAVGPGNPGWSSCQKGRRVRTANRWAVGGATRRCGGEVQRPSGRRTRLSRARLGKVVGVPRGADDPQGPIGREQAGSPAGHPDGALGGCPSQLRAPRRSASACGLDAGSSPTCPTPAPTTGRPGASHSSASPARR
jgi:hypothetical protein